MTDDMSGSGTDQAFVRKVLDDLSKLGLNDARLCLHLRLPQRTLTLWRKHCPPEGVTLLRIVHDAPWVVEAWLADARAAAPCAPAPPFLLCPVRLRVCDDLGHLDESKCPGERS